MTSTGPASPACRGSSNAYAIVFAALLVPAGPHRRPARPQARLPRRPRALPRRLGRFGARRRRSSVLVGARDRAGRRRRAAWCRPRSASCCPSSRPRSARPRSARGRRSAASPRPPARRSAGCWSRRAGAGCSSSTCRSALVALVVGGAHAAASAATRSPAPSPDVLGAVDARERDRRARRSGSSKGPDWGWGSTGVLASFAAAAVLLAAFLARSRAPSRARRRAADAARALVRCRERSARSCSSPPSPRCCSRGVLFLTGVWHYSVLRAGLEPRPRAR